MYAIRSYYDGWKVANVPLVPGIDPPEELFKIDPGRVFGLQIGRSQLLSHRVKRLRNFKNTDNTSYIDEQGINEEIRRITSYNVCYTKLLRLTIYSTRFAIPS